jgi:hypothetical protein
MFEIDQLSWRASLIITEPSTYLFKCARRNGEFQLTLTLVLLGVHACNLTTFINDLGCLCFSLLLNWLGLS